jgi:4-hydroxy-tetrahydrodipicolinate reductase
MTIRVCVAGATGWAGSALSRGIFEAPDMELVAGIARSQAASCGVRSDRGLAAPVFGTMAEGLETKPDGCRIYQPARGQGQYYLSAARRALSW